MLMDTVTFRFQSLLLLGILSAKSANVSAQTFRTPASTPAASAFKTLDNYGRLPLSFEANEGQAAREVKFLARGNGYSLFLTDSGAVLALGKPSPRHAQTNSTKAGPPDCQNSSTQFQDVVRMTLAGARSTSPSLSGDSSHPAAIGEDELPGKVNYFIGNDPSRWRSDLPTFAKVRYSNVYPGVDLLYYGNQRQLEYDFVVAPGASPADVRLKFKGQKRFTITPNGDLVLSGHHGSAIFHKPLIYQEYKGERQSIQGTFALASSNTIRFQLGPYDHTRPLIIDPVLVYSTYLGGTGTIFFGYYQGDQGHGIAIDSSGNAYVVGQTASMNFPITGGSYQARNKAVLAGSGPTAFITKLNASGTALVYSTYLGGSGQGPVTGQGDSGSAIALDAENNAYVAGSTWSPDFPVTAGALLTTNPNIYNNGSIYTGQMGFVTKLNAKGNALVYSTYLGGASVDNAPVGNFVSAIAVDSTGDAYLTGLTSCPTFPITPGAFKSKYLYTPAQPGNAFVTKLNPTGTGVIYSTYLGGTGYESLGDTGTAIAIDSAGDAYVAGSTYSADFPVTTGAFQTAYKGNSLHSSNVFVTELNPTGTAEIYSTYLGGTGQPSTDYPFGINKGDGANAIAIDSSGNAYVAGLAGSLDFPVKGGVLQTGPGAFITKLNATGSEVYYSTYLGGLSSSATGVAVDTTGVAYLVGNAYANYFAQTTDAFPGNGAFLAKLNAAGNALNFASLFGGSANNSGLALALDNAGNVYLTGYTGSSDFPVTTGAFQTINRSLIPPDINGDLDETSNAFISKIALAGETTDSYPAFTTITPSAKSVKQGSTLTLNAKVFSLPGDPVPTGQVTITGVGLPAPVITLDSSGNGSWTTSTLSPGLYQPQLVYAGDADHLSNTLPQQPAPFRIVGPPAILSNATGGNYNFTYGEFSNLSLLIRVADSASYGLSGVTVNLSGAGLAITPASAVTNADGIATFSFTATKAGDPLYANASVSGLTPPLAIPIYVNPAPLTVYLRDNWRYYGAANPTVKVAITGLVGSDTVTVTQQTTAAVTSPVGIYPVTATVGGPDVSNYALTVVNTTLQVRKLLLNIVPATELVTYGQTPPPPTQYAFKGFVNGDTASVVTGAPLLSSTVTSTTPVGYYPIKITPGTLSAQNYYFAAVSQAGSVHVTKAPLTLQANNLTMPQGGPIPPLTYTYSGFVNGDTAATRLTGAPQLATTATTHSNPGRYPIYISTGTLKSSDYHITPVDGVLTIEP